jgi:hypothetical protein
MEGIGGGEDVDGMLVSVNVAWPVEVGEGPPAG